MEPHEVLDYDDIVPLIGEFGKWQKILFALLSIPSALSAMAVFMYEFIAFVPPHRCQIETCDNKETTFHEDFVRFAIPRDPSANMTSKCSMFRYLNDSSTCSEDSFSSIKTTVCQDGWVFDKSTFEWTAGIEFEMVCDDAWKKSFAQSFYMLGMLVGSIVFGYMSDHIGRRHALVVSSTILALGGFVSAMLPGEAHYYPLFVVCRFASGLGHVGCFMLAFGLVVEYVGPKYRVFCGCLIEIPFALGGIIVGILSWVGVRNWRVLQGVCSLPSLLIIFYECIIPESPRWLLGKGKLKELMTDIRKTAQINGKRVPEDLLGSDHFKADVCATAEEESHSSILDLFRPWPICLRTLVMFYNWMITTLCYYGLTMTASTLSANLFLNYTLLILVEIPAYIFCIYLLDVWGRKKILTLSFILAGISCIIAGLVDIIPWLQVTLSIMGKFGATSAFAIIFVYTAELYPTLIRSTAIGSSSMCGRIGGFVAPQVAFLAMFWKPLPLLVMGGVTLLGGIGTMLVLPETLGKKLPETTEEALNLSKSAKESHVLRENNKNI